MKPLSFPPKFVYIAALAILLAVSFLAGSLTTRDQHANAQGVNNAANPAALNGYFSCPIQEVAVYSNRIHVRCWREWENIVYFAYPVTSVTESRQANRYLAILNTAYALGRPVWVNYDDNPAANPPGCLAVDCRLIVALDVRP